MKKIELTIEQLNTFKKIWNVYGNGGRKHTLMNHKLIKAFYEDHEDKRELYKNSESDIRARYGNIPSVMKNLVTDDCLKACELILENKIESALRRSRG